MKQLFLLLGLSVFILSCNSENNSQSTDNQQDNKTTSNITDTLYPFETGIVKYVDNDGDTVMVTIFKDYGKTEKIYMNEDTKGFKSLYNSRIILIKDGYISNATLSMKFGTKRKYTDFNFIRINPMHIENLNNDTISVKKIGEENILGHTCAVYKLNDNENYDRKYYIWHNLILKREFVGTLTAVEIIENPDVDTVDFNIPDSVSIYDWEEGM